MAAPETTTAAAPTDPGLASDSPGEAPTVAKKAKLGFGGWLALAWLVAIVIMALFASFLPLEDPARSAFRPRLGRSEEHTSELQSLMRISYAVFCLKTKKNNT